MNPIVAHLISGQVLFTALPIMAAMVMLCDAVTRPDLRRLVTVIAWNFGLGPLDQCLSDVNPRRA